MDKIQKIAFPEALIKFGYTNEKFAENRFSEAYHRLWNFANTPLGRDYDVHIQWSAWVTKERALELEKEYAEFMGPKDFWCEEQYNGINECRLYTEERRLENLQKWYKLYPKGSTKRVDNLVHVYFAVFLLKSKVLAAAK